MKFRKFVCALIVALFSLSSLQFTARADEGMWPFNNIPRDEIKRKYGFDVTDEWLKKVQLASVRFNNGVRDFVGPALELLVELVVILRDNVVQLGAAHHDY